MALDAAADLVAEREDAVVGDAVAHRVAVLLAHEEARAVQEAEMLGDVLLGGRDRYGQRADRQGPVAQRVEDPDTGRLAEEAEPLGDHLRHRHVHLMSDRHRTPPARWFGYTTAQLHS